MPCFCKSNFSSASVLVTLCSTGTTTMLSICLLTCSAKYIPQVRWWSTIIVVKYVPKIGKCSPFLDSNQDFKQWSISIWMNEWMNWMIKLNENKQTTNRQQTDNKEKKQKTKKIRRRKEWMKNVCVTCDGGLCVSTERTYTLLDRHLWRRGRL